jgi:hypothetical protein
MEEIEQRLGIRVSGRSSHCSIGVWFSIPGDLYPMSFAMAW